VPTFDGLLLYEWVLLVLGVVLFVVLVIAFLYQILHKRSFAALLAFFTVPIAMIAYPSVKSLQVGGAILTVDQTRQAVLKDPGDPGLRNQLKQQLAVLGDRPIKDPAAQAHIAEAEFLVGNEQKASERLNLVLRADPGQQEAKRLQERIATLSQLDKTAAEVEKNPQDAAAKAELSKTLSAVQLQPATSPVALTKIANAQAALGERENAVRNNSLALKLNPQLESAIQLQKKIAH
jgi:tetratricopeptide (TPR) repeat protein